MTDLHERWTARTDGSGVVLVRELDCEMCCKRRKDNCPVCGGTKRRTIEYAVPREVAETLCLDIDRALG